MVRIIYNLDTTVSVIHPASNSLLPVSEILDRATPSGAVYDDVDESTLPLSREFRDAWQGSKGKGIHIDETKKQEIIDRRANEKLVSDKMRANAIAELKTEGKLPVGYT